MFTVWNLPAFHPQFGPWLHPFPDSVAAAPTSRHILRPGPTGAHECPSQQSLLPVTIIKNNYLQNDCIGTNYLTFSTSITLACMIVESL